MTFEEALQRLKAGNKVYLKSEICGGDISPAVRERTGREGQHPYATVVTCSDSRVIPESIFSAGIGELFVIRAAGNVVGNLQLGSIEYATEHLKTPLVLVLGHSGCGAVGAAIGSSPTGFVKYITDQIKEAIGAEKDDLTACGLNVKRTVEKIKSAFPEREFEVVGAIYNLMDGTVNFL